MVSILAKLGGRKFLMALFGTIAIALHSFLGIDENAVMTLGAVIAAYVFGQGIADGLSGGETSSAGARAAEDVEG